jgi:hypothetical protein
MDSSATRANGAVTLRIQGEIDAVGIPDRPLGDELIAERQSSIVAALSDSEIIKSLDLGVGAVVFLYKKAKEDGGAMTVQDLCGQPLAIVNVLCMEHQPAGTCQSRHIAHGYLHLATNRIAEPPFTGRPPHAQVSPPVR